MRVAVAPRLDVRRQRRLRHVHERRERRAEERDFDARAFANARALVQRRENRAVRVNPLAERLPDPDNPAPKWEPNPDLDFTKKDDRAGGE